MGPLRKIALITGSTSGIGLNIAQRFAKAGNSVVLTGRGEQIDIFREILNFKKQYHDRVTFVHGDFTSTESVVELCKDITNIHRCGVDILVNNAGFQYTRPIESHNLQTWQDMLSVHLTAPFLLVQHFLPYMKRKGWGRIINISALHGMIGEHGKASFCASKAGLIGLTKVVSLEASQYGVTCNAVCPSNIDTDSTGTSTTGFDTSGRIIRDEAKELFLEDSYPTLRLVTSEQVASLVLHLCSDKAASINGAAIPVNGGRTIQ